jgi:hypothetical protein
MGLITLLRIVGADGIYKKLVDALRLPTTVQKNS